jgi:hypothetical protein
VKSGTIYVKSGTCVKNGTLLPNPGLDLESKEQLLVFPIAAWKMALWLGSRPFCVKG